MPQQISVPGMGVVEFPDGMNDAQITAAIQKNMPAQSSVGADMAKSAGVGVGKGFIGLAGLPGDLAEMGARGIDRATQYVGGKLGLDAESLRRPEPAKNLTSLITGPTDRPQYADRAPTYGSADITKAVESQTGPFYQPQTTAGKYAETVGEFAPGLIGGPAGLARRAITNVVLPGVSSEAAGQATQGTAAEPYARVAGAILGGIAPSSIARAVTPLPASPARQRLVDILNNEGVTSLTAGQRTGSPALRYAESALGDAPGAGGQTTAMTNEGRAQFTDAALRRAGTGGEASPQVLAANNARLGNEFETLSARNTLQMDPQFANDIRGVIREYGTVLPSEQRQRVYNVLTDLGQYGNAIPGDVYQATRSRLSRVANNNRGGVGDPDFGDAMRGIRNALDDAMGRSITPADQQAWQAARQQYGAQKTIEKAAARGPADATAEGVITPTSLKNIVASGKNAGQYARGQGDFSELARAGTGIMGAMPQSGTGPRLTMQTIASLLGGAVGAGGGPVGAGLGAATAAAAGPALVGRAIMSRPVQGYLGNQVATNALQNLDPRRAAIVGALMAAEQQRLAAPR